MPELPEVETVVKTLNNLVKGKAIKDVKVYYDKIIDNIEVKQFINKVKNQKINNIFRRGKFIIFQLDDYYLLSHLRMEGKYFIRNKEDEVLKHEHVSFILDDNTTLRYNDTRKFGRMYLVNKDELYTSKPLKDLGLEPFDTNLNVEYLKDKYSKKNKEIKSILLDQSIITGIGNIYADEILFMSNINPYKKANQLNDIEINNIINNTITVLNKAITLGGTTIRSYESSEGVHGLFQNSLLVHSKANQTCPVCKTLIIKEFINTRGTYYCPKCQK